MHTTFRKTTFLILLLAILILPRLVSLDSFVTTDEPFWLSVGANFYYALGQREFENTVYEYHPAVTTMWFVTDALLVYFPEYRGLGQGYFDVDKAFFDPFLIEYGIDPMLLLVYSRLFQIAVIVLFGLIIFYLLSQMFGDEKAFLYTTLISSAPFFLGHSRVLSHEALVAFFSMASIFGLVAYLEFEHKWQYLLISAASAALAQLTKSSAMALFPAIGLMFVLGVFEKTKVNGYKQALTGHLKIFGVWFVAFGITYFVLWPGMWVAPGKMLYEVYGNAFSYAFEGARLQVTEELHPEKFEFASTWAAAQGFISSIKLRMTNPAWIGFGLAIVSFFIRGAATSVEKKLVLYLSVTAASFVFLFSAAQGRNSAHYIMTSHVAVDMIAALGWGIMLGRLPMLWETAKKPLFQYGCAGLLIAWQLGSAFAFYPYYYTFYNPLIGASNSDYGEGFEHAAQYLNEKPDAKSLKVLSFRARGPFSYFFKGETIILNPLFLEEPGMPSMLERLEPADYLVVNTAFALRNERTLFFMSALDGVAPEKIIEINGVSEIYIYNMADVPPSFYETIAE